MTVQELISLFGRYRHRTNDIEISQCCGLGASSTSANLKTTNPIVFFAYNQQVSFPATAGIPMTVCTIQAPSTFCYYLVSIDLNKNVVVTKGINNVYLLPSPPAGGIPVGSFLVSTDASTTFTSGTTSLTDAGIAVNFYDIDCGISLQLINQTQRRVEQGITITRKGSQRTIMDWDYMMVRATVSLAAGDSIVVLPFPNFKDFVDQGISISDASGLSTRVEKEDSLPTGISISMRPQKISRRIVTETHWTLPPGGYIATTEDDALVTAPDIWPGMQFDLWPVCDQAYTLDVQAYQYSPYLDGVIYSENWMTQNASDVLLFGALAESGLYFGDDPQIKVWEARFQEAVWTLSASQEKAKYSGSHIGTKFPNPLNRTMPYNAIYTGYPYV